MERFGVLEEWKSVVARSFDTKDGALYISDDLKYQSCIKQKHVEIYQGKKKKNSISRELISCQTKNIQVLSSQKN